MSDLNLEQPKRQSIVGVAVLFFKNLRTAINILVTVIFVQFGADFAMLGMGIEEWGLVLGVVFLVISYLQYRKFYFYAREDHFIIEKGVLRQEKVNIAFERIQTVNTTQNIVQQLFKVVGLKIDTAGSSQMEIEIPALERNYAKQLQQYLLERKGETQQETEEAPEQAEEKEAAEPLIHLNPRELLKVGLTENHLRSGFLLFAVVNGYIWQYEEYLLKPFEPYLEQTADTFLAQWVLLLPFAILAFVVVSVLVSLIRVFLRYFNFSFYLDARGLRTVGGLLQRQEYHVPGNKIQYFTWKSNPLRALVGYRTLVVKQAGTQETAERQSVKVPGCDARSLVKVLQKFYTQRHQGKYSRFKAHRLLFIQLMGRLATVPVGILFAIMWYNDFGWIFYAPLILLWGAIAFFVYRYYQSVSMRVNEGGIEIRKGWMFPARCSIQYHKLQNVRLKRSIFQKPRGLASLVFYTAAGSETIPHLAGQEAKALYDYILYRIEATDESWM